MRTTPKPIYMTADEIDARIETRTVAMDDDVRLVRSDWIWSLLLMLGFDIVWIVALAAAVSAIVVLFR
jgi:hypothetical protein